ncbi:MAG TPA: xanthine dehydrogenase subunit D [Actinomycetota bacterium]|nr:xanthine dehydrogenase subunit D [Actinomycetota bacterium]
MSAPRSVRTRMRGGVGESARRPDGIPKVKGAFAYGSDLWDERMLIGATLRSPHPFATIRAIDASGALALQGVHAVLLAEDVPGDPNYGLEFRDQPVLAADVVRYAGEPVAIVAAESPELAARAVELIDVDYDLREPLTDMEHALAPDAPRLHGWGNVVRHLRIEHGDPEVDADVWIDGYYETAWQDQAPLGPEGGLAVPAEDGGIELFVTTQWLHVDRLQIAPCLRLPEDKVRIHLAGIGGAFGSREDLHVQIHSCMLALRTGRPVKMTYGREESFSGHVHRHPSRVWIRHGATREGDLVCVRARVLIDGGAYSSSSPAVIGNATSFAAGPYEVPNALLEGSAVYTNNPPCGAMRGFGAPQVAFAVEGQMDKLADALGIDRVELRRRNALRSGSVLPTGQVLQGSAPLPEVIDACTSMPLPAHVDPADRDPVTLPGGAGNVGRGEGLRRGMGFALGFKNIGYSEGFDDFHQARVTLSRGTDGPIAEVRTAAVEVGQGLGAVMTQVVRTELGVENVVLHTADTELESAGSTSASRQTLMASGALQLACRGVLEELGRRAGAPLADGTTTIEEGSVAVEGRAVGDLMDLLEEPVAATRTFRHRPTTPMDEKGQGDLHPMFSFAAMRAVVDVDRDLGLVRVVHLDSVVDVGTAINPQLVEGQSEGGAAMGLGLAVMEELQVRDGVIRNPSFTDYLLPTILDAPSIDTVIVEEPEPGAPFGVKGVGESATIVALPAVVAAIRDATGLELNRAPVRPDDIAGLTGPVTTGGWPPVPDVPGEEPVPTYQGALLSQRATGGGVDP